MRRDAFERAGELAPGLYVGLAGLAWVLAERGLLDEARDLLARADRHPLSGECATLFAGSAGIALTHLALFGHTRDEHHLDRALALAASLPSGDALTGQLGADDATGLLHGRCGVALMLQQLADATGDAAHVARGIRLLHAELDRAVDPEAAGLLFPVSAADTRAMPYLYCGSAGLAHTATRYLCVTEDERLAGAMPRLLAPVTGTYTVMPSLYSGLAGFAFTLADHAELTGDPATRQTAVRVARALFKYAVPHASGVRFLGEGLLRYSADLWSGSAGILLALTQVLDPRPGGLFTVDAFAAERSATAVMSAG
jgi:lantibiotic modifying enzyme